MTIQIRVYLGVEKDGKVIQLENYVRHASLELNESGELINTNRIQFSIDTESLASATHIILTKGSLRITTDFRLWTWVVTKLKIGDQLVFHPGKLKVSIGA